MEHGVFGTGGFGHWVSPMTRNLQEGPLLIVKYISAKIFRSRPKRGITRPLSRSYMGERQSKTEATDAHDLCRSEFIRSQLQPRSLLQPKSFIRRGASRRPKAQATAAIRAKRNVLEQVWQSFLHSKSAISGAGKSVAGRRGRSTRQAPEPLTEKLPPGEQPEIRGVR